MTTKAQVREQEEARAQLLEILKPGDTIYTIVRHVAPSGMTRWIDCYVMRDNEPRWLSYTAAKAIGRPVNTRNHEGVEMGGCGMDMGFALVYDIARTVFRDGFECIATGDDWPGQTCPSNDHVNHRGDGQHPKHHDEGGYALNQRWI